MFLTFYNLPTYEMQIFINQKTLRDDSLNVQSQLPPALVVLVYKIKTLIYLIIIKIVDYGVTLLYRYFNNFSKLQF